MCITNTLIFGRVFHLNIGHRFFDFVALDNVKRQPPNSLPMPFIAGYQTLKKKMIWTRQIEYKLSKQNKV